MATPALSADEPTACAGPARGAETTVRANDPSPLEGTTRWPRPGGASGRVWAALLEWPRRVPDAAWLAGGILGLGVLVVLVVALATRREQAVSRVEPLTHAAAPAMPSGMAAKPATASPAPSPAAGTPVNPPPAKPSAATARVRLTAARPTASGSTPGGAAARDPARARPAPAKKSGGRQHRGRSKANETARGPAVVELKVIPWGTILVDGVEKGNAPVMRTVTLSPGRHTITVRHPGYGEMRQTINVRAGEQRTMRFDLGSRR